MKQSITNNTRVLDILYFFISFVMQKLCFFVRFFFYFL